MKRRFLLTKLFLGAAAVPAIVKADERKPDFEHIGGDYFATPRTENCEITGDMEITVELGDPRLGKPIPTPSAPPRHPLQRR